MNPAGSKDADAGISVEGIDGLLPQTQCTGCGYPSCREYAEALTGGLVALNRCAPAEAFGSGFRRGAALGRGAHRRAVVYRLYIVHSGLSGGRHTGRRQAYAHGYRERVHRL